jgi:cob(I)alamin adenosyltransferase
MPSDSNTGMVIIYTGHGKGKTTAALGLALRAAGHGRRVLILQFMKGDWEYGELKGIERLHPEVTITPLGIGCVGILGDDKPLEEHQKAADEALGIAREAMSSNQYDIIILDEINIAAHLNLLTVTDVIQLIADRPRNLTLVLTGRFADDKFIEVADLVTEMKEIKHPFQKGITSRKGIDY